MPDKDKLFHEYRHEIYSSWDVYSRPKELNLFVYNMVTIYLTTCIFIIHNTHFSVVSWIARLFCITSLTQVTLVKQTNNFLQNIIFSMNQHWFLYIFYIQNTKEMVFFSQFILESMLDINIKSCTWNKTYKGVVPKRTNWIYDLITMLFIALSCIVD